MASESTATTSFLEKVLGSKLEGHGDSSVDVSEIAANASAVGIYFSAHWCPPCRAFTPELASSYAALKKNKKFEVVFASADKNANSFNEYFGQMPWPAVPFSDRQRFRQLEKIFGIQGYPTLVIVNPVTGQVLSKDGVQAVYGDPTGNDYPWIPKSAKELCASSVVGVDGKQLAPSHFEGKSVCLFFGAHGDQASLALAAAVKKAYTVLKDQSKPVEFITLAFDRDEASFNKLIALCPWPHIPFNKRAVKADIASRFDLETVPAFCVFDWNTSKVLNGKALTALLEDPQCTDFPWLPKPVVTLNMDTADLLNNSPCVLAFVESSESKTVMATLTEIAKELAPSSADPDSKSDSSPSSLPTLKFVVATPGMLTDRVKTVMQIESQGPVLAILDIPNQCMYKSKLKKVEDLTADAIRSFVQSYNEGSLTASSLE